MSEPKKPREFFIYTIQLNFKDGHGKVWVEAMTKQQMKASQDDSAFTLMREVTDAPTAEQVFERVIEVIKKDAERALSMMTVYETEMHHTKWIEWLESKRESILKGDK